MINNEQQAQQAREQMWRLNEALKLADAKGACSDSWREILTQGARDQIEELQGDLVQWHSRQVGTMLTQQQRIGQSAELAGQAKRVLDDIALSNDWRNRQKITQALWHLRTACACAQYAEREAAGVEMPKLER